MVREIKELAKHGYCKVKVTDIQCGSCGDGIKSGIIGYGQRYEVYSKGCSVEGQMSR